MNPSRRRPAPSGGSSRDVRRPGRLHRALRPARPGGDARGPPRLPEHGRGRDRALRGARGQAHGRRRAGLLRLAPGARGRGRARRAGWARDRGGRRPARHTGRASRSRPGSGSRPASWSWATSSARARRRRRRSSARPRTLPPGCRRLAAPGTVVVAEGTRRLLGEAVRAARARTASGSRASPARARLPGRSASGRPRAASRPTGRAGSLPMVGRDQELALVLERWRQAAAGEGQAVLLVGEAGIGKSRLVRAALDAVAGEEHVALRYQCSPHHTGTRALAGDPAARARRRLRARPTRGGEARQARGAAARRGRRTSARRRRWSRRCSGSTPATATPARASRRSSGAPAPWPRWSTSSSARRGAARC